MADEFVDIPERNTNDPNAAADINQLMKNIRVISGNNTALRIGKTIKFETEYEVISSTHPWLCLSDDDAVLSTTHYSSAFLDALRAIPLRYDPTGINKTAFDVTAWAISSNVATLTFENDDPENTILARLAEDQLVHGSYTDWLTITLESDIGDITAGTYAVTSMSVASRTISFAFTASNNSGSVTATASFYPHRIAGSTTTARHRSCAGRGFHMTGDNGDFIYIGGLRVRDAFQGHYHHIYQKTASGSTYSWDGSSNYNANKVINNNYDEARDPRSDGSHGDPRFAPETRGKSLGIYVYLYVGEYTT